MHTTAEELLREDALQRQGAQVLADLQLVPILAAWGTPHLIGSMAMQFMVSRDIDFNVLVDRVDAEVLAIAYGLLLPILKHPRVSRLWYASQLGRFNPDGTVEEEGFYCGVRYRTDAGEDWKIDIWTVQPPRPEIALVHRMQAFLTPELRLAIMRMKQHVKGEPSYARAGIHSRHVYDAALDGVRDPDEFRAWLRKRAPP